MQAANPYRDDPRALREALDELKSAKPMRARDAAAFLGVSEGELVACRVGTEAVRLHASWLDILKRVESLGRVMALTRNDAVVHERKGIYGNLSATGQIGLALGDDIDLRLFFSAWKHGYAVVEGAGEETKRSLQFFDASGAAVHKVHLLAESSVDEFELLVEQFRDENQAPGETVETMAAAEPELPDAEIDVPRFREGWAGLKDTHEFFGLLRNHRLKRRQALRLAEKQYAQPVAPSAARAALEQAAASGLPIMCFVGNHGCIQIHTGPVANIKVMGTWLNVLDPNFNLHLREDLIDQAWVVRKPTTEGIVTSLELFTADGELMAQFFGQRKPGIPEQEGWRALIGDVARQTAHSIPTAEAA